ncbi:MAG: hypothetical protein ACI920_002574 [Saprospiraceae bacterium]|jgi:hypothetical protein
MCEVLGVSTSGYYYWQAELKDDCKTPELFFTTNQTLPRDGAMFFHQRMMASTTASRFILIMNF